MDISDSGFISPAAFSTEWQSIALLQQRNHNCLYTASRYGKRYVLKGLSADSQSLTDMLLLQQKEFSLGITLSHPNIAETYSLEEVADCGRCIVMEYVDGITLAEWLPTNPSHSARQRAMLQLLDALEYIHSLQLVHHDLKSSNILITRNGQNVKLIDFGLSDTDSTSDNNDASIDIQLFGNILALLFPRHYRSIARACQQGKYSNIATLKQAFQRQHIWRKSVPYLVSVICIIISCAILFYNQTQQLREQKMIDAINYHVNLKITELQNSADTLSTYLEFSQKHYGTIWQETAIVRDSIANLYSDEPKLRLQCIEMWTLIFGERFMQLDTQVKQTKSLQKHDIRQPTNRY